MPLKVLIPLRVKPRTLPAPVSTTALWSDATMIAPPGVTLPASVVDAHPASIRPSTVAPPAHAAPVSSRRRSNWLSFFVCIVSLSRIRLEVEFTTQLNLSGSARAGGSPDGVECAETVPTAARSACQVGEFAGGVESRSHVDEAPLRVVQNVVELQP